MRVDARVVSDDPRGMVSIRQARNARPLPDVERCHWCGHPVHDALGLAGECAYCPCKVEPDVAGAKANVVGVDEILSLLSDLKEEEED